MSFVVEGSPLRLGAQIGKGGEGTVFQVLGSSGVVAKIYNSENLARNREAKIDAAIGSPLTKKINEVCFPLEKVFRSDGRFCGFTMRAVREHFPIFEVFGPGSRKKRIPKVDFRFLVRIATNLAIAVSRVHQLGFVIGDLNSNGILVSEDATVQLIDADSFQYSPSCRNLFCSVGVPDFTPPELDGADFSKTARTEQHDAFGLAVAIFQTLFNGRHPYMGTYARGEKTLREAINEHRFVYSELRNVDMHCPPGMEFYALMPGDLKGAFDQAFGVQSMQLRPDPASWVDLLRKFEGSLVKCGTASAHYFPRSMLCPWCELSNRTGIELFPPTIEDLQKRYETLSPEKAINQLNEEWHRLTHGFDKRFAGIKPKTPNFGLSPNKELSRIGAKGESRKILGAIFAAVLIGVLFFAAEAFVFCIAAFILTFSFFWGGESIQEAATKRTNALNRAYASAVENWRRLIGVQRLYELYNEAFDSYYELKDRQNEQNREFAQIEQQQNALRINLYLSQFSISGVRSSKIRDNDRVALVSYGIETAADVSADRVLRVPGIGPKKKDELIRWRNQLSKLYVPSGSAPAEEKRLLAQMRYDHATELRQLIGVATDKLNKFGAFKKRFESAASKLDENLQTVLREREQHRLNIISAKFQIVSLVEVPDANVAMRVRKEQKRKSQPTRRTATRPRSNRSIQRQATAAPNCPKCSSIMVRRTARRGRFAGKDFWGCSRYPRCKGIVNI